MKHSCLTSGNRNKVIFGSVYLHPGDIAMAICDKLSHLKTNIRDDKKSPTNLHKMENQKRTHIHLIFDRNTKKKILTLRH